MISTEKNLTLCARTDRWPDILLSRFRLPPSAVRPEQLRRQLPLASRSQPFPECRSRFSTSLRLTTREHFSEQPGSLARILHRFSVFSICPHDKSCAAAERD